MRHYIAFIHAAASMIRMHVISSWRTVTSASSVIAGALTQFRVSPNQYCMSSNGIKTSPKAPAAARKADRKTEFTRIGFLVHDVSRMRRTLFDKAVKPLGITRAQWWVIANLSRNKGDGMIQSDLARVLDVGKVSIGVLVDRLEESGHIERRPDPVDRRLKRLYITKLGYEVIEQMQDVGKDLNDVVLDGISKDDVRIAEDVMHRMKENIRRQLNGSDSEDEDIAFEKPGRSGRVKAPAVRGRRAKTAG